MRAFHGVLLSLGFSAFSEAFAAKVHSPTSVVCVEKGQLCCFPSPRLVLDIPIGFFLSSPRIQIMSSPVRNSKRIACGSDPFLSFLPSTTCFLVPFRRFSLSFFIDVMLFLRGSSFRSVIYCRAVFLWFIFVSAFVLFFVFSILRLCFPFAFLYFLQNVFSLSLSLSAES